MASKYSTSSEEQREKEKELLYVMMNPVVKLYRIDQFVESSLQVKSSPTPAPASTVSIHQKAEDLLKQQSEDHNGQEPEDHLDNNLPPEVLTPPVHPLMEAVPTSSTAGTNEEGKTHVSMLLSCPQPSLPPVLQPQPVRTTPATSTSSRTVSSLSVFSSTATPGNAGPSVVHSLSASIATPGIPEPPTSVPSWAKSTCYKRKRKVQGRVKNLPVCTHCEQPTQGHRRYKNKAFCLVKMMSTSRGLNGRVYDSYEHFTSVVDKCDEGIIPDQSVESSLQVKMSSPAPASIVYIIKQEPEDHLKHEPEDHLKKEPEDHIKQEPKDLLKQEPEDHLKQEPEDHLKQEPEVLKAEDSDLSLPPAVLPPPVHPLIEDVPTSSTAGRNEGRTHVSMLLSWPQPSLPLVLQPHIYLLLPVRNTSATSTITTPVSPLSVSTATPGNAGPSTRTTMPAIQANLGNTGPSKCSILPASQSQTTTRITVSSTRPTIPATQTGTGSNFSWSKSAYYRRRRKIVGVRNLPLCFLCGHMGHMGHKKYKKKYFCPVGMMSTTRGLTDRTFDSYEHFTSVVDELNSSVPAGMAKLPLPRRNNFATSTVTRPVPHSRHAATAAPAIGGPSTRPTNPASPGTAGPPTSTPPTPPTMPVTQTVNWDSSWAKSTNYKRRNNPRKQSRVKNLPLCMLCGQLAQGHRRYKKKPFCAVQMMSTSSGLDNRTFDSYEHFTSVVDTLNSSVPASTAGTKEGGKKTCMLLAWPQPSLPPVLQPLSVRKGPATSTITRPVPSISATTATPETSGPLTQPGQPIMSAGQATSAIGGPSTLTAMPASQATPAIGDSATSTVTRPVPHSRYPASLGTARPPTSTPPTPPTMSVTQTVNWDLSWAKSTNYKRRNNQWKQSRIKNLPLCTLCGQLAQGHRRYKKKAFCPVQMMSPSSGLDNRTFNSYEHFTSVVDTLNSSVPASTAGIKEGGKKTCMLLSLPQPSLPPVLQPLSVRKSPATSTITRPVPSISATTATPETSGPLTQPGQPIMPASQATSAIGGPSTLTAMPASQATPAVGDSATSTVTRPVPHSRYPASPGTAHPPTSTPPTPPTMSVTQTVNWDSSWAKSTNYKRRNNQWKQSRIKNLPLCTLCGQLAQGHRRYKKKAFCPVQMMSPSSGLDNRTFNSYEHFTSIVDMLNSSVPASTARTKEGGKKTSMLLAWPQPSLPPVLQPLSVRKSPATSTVTRLVPSISATTATPGTNGPLTQPAMPDSQATSAIGGPSTLTAMPASQATPGHVTLPIMPARQAKLPLPARNNSATSTVSRPVPHSRHAATAAPAIGGPSTRPTNPASPGTAGPPTSTPPTPPTMPVTQTVNWDSSWAKSTNYKRRNNPRKQSRVKNLPLCTLCGQLAQGHQRYKKKPFCAVQMMSTSSGLDNRTFDSYEHFTSAVDKLCSSSLGHV